MQCANIHDTGCLTTENNNAILQGTLGGVYQGRALFLAARGVLTLPTFIASSGCNPD